MLRKLKQLDIGILLILGCFLVISTAVIYSATHNTKYQGLHINNLVTFTVLMLPMLAIALMDYRFLVRKLSPYLYGAGILMLVFVMFKGMNINGSRRWINLAVMQFQPSELMKVFFIVLLLAKWLEKRNGEELRFWGDLVPLGAILAVPFIMIFMQPDLGTSIVFVCIFLGMLWLGNIKMSHVLIGSISLSAIIAFVTGLYFYDFALFSKIVKPHQLHRVQTFLDPSSDRRTVGTL